MRDNQLANYVGAPRQPRHAEAWPKARAKERARRRRRRAARRGGEAA